MANGVNGENILLVLRLVELGVKQDLVLVTILSHLVEENNARAHHQNQRNVTVNHAEVRIYVNYFMSLGKLD